MPVMIHLIHSFQPPSTGFSFSAEAGEVETAFPSLRCQQGSTQDLGAADWMWPRERRICRIKCTERQQLGAFFFFPSHADLSGLRSHRRCPVTGSKGKASVTETPGLCSFLIPEHSMELVRSGSSAGGFILRYWPVSHF